MATKRSLTRTESDEDLDALSVELRRIATALDDVHTEIDKLSKPVYDTGWPYPIGSMRLFAVGLYEWANTIEAITETPQTTGE